MSSNGNAKLAAAVVGGYVLGRTKKGKAAIRFAMWVSGNQGMISQQVGTLVKSDQANALLGQIQGPVLEAIQQAALRAATARMNQLSTGLASRTEALESAEDITAGVGEKVGKGVSGAGKSVGGAAGKLTSKLHRGKAKDEEEPEADETDETEEPQDAQPEPDEDDDEDEADEESDDELDEDESDEDESEEDTEDDDEESDDSDDEPDDDDEYEDEEEEPPPPAKKTPAKKAAKKAAAKKRRRPAPPPEDDEDEDFDDDEGE